MTTDKATGLPELPEGDWWEVRRRNVSAINHFDYSSFTYQDGYEVAWMTPNVKKTKTVYRRKHWYSFFKSYFEVYSEEPVVLGREQIFHADTITGKKYTKNITADDVRYAAIRLVNQRKAETTTRSLLGKYPPKKLS